MTRPSAAALAAASFVEALRSIPPARAQSRLLSTKDGDLAALLSVIAADDAQLVFSLVSVAKAERLRGEVERMAHIRLDPATIERIAEHLAEHLTGEKPLGPASRYLRPRRN